MDGTEADLPLAYRSFARQAGGYCPEYERLALGVADDAELLRRLSDLPQSQRQPNLLFGVTRLLGGPVENWPDFRSWVLAHWWQAQRELLRRSTQTNEAGRCATLLPYLPLDRPLALLELGCSAGLCLHPDRYGYRYTGTDRSTAPVLLAGEQEPLLDCRLGVGITPPAGLPSSPGAPASTSTRST